MSSDASDYDEFTSSTNPLMAFTSDPSTHRQCFNVSIVDDRALEDTEKFSLSLSLAGGFTVPVIIVPDSSEVEIKDDDCESNPCRLKYPVIYLLFSHYCWI